MIIKGLVIYVISGVFLLLLMCVSCNDSKPRKSSVDNLTQQEREQGHALYRSKCMNCHMPQGEGLKNSFPPLAGSDFLEKYRDLSLSMVKYGSSTRVRVNGVDYEGVMPAAGLNDRELVLVFNYILNSWGNDLGRVTLKDVRSVVRP